MRVAAYVDGFNLYHAIKDLRENHLKWVDLWALAERFAKPPRYELIEVNYFTAFATWRLGPYSRHRLYVKALQAQGVSPVLGKFKKKERGCRKCGHQWQGHEEKETDVNIAVRLVSDAFLDRFDRALVVTGDSDIAPAILTVKDHFPHKSVLILSPPGRGWSHELVQATGGRRNLRILKRGHIERALLPASLEPPTAGSSIVRPAEYDLPLDTEN